MVIGYQISKSLLTRFWREASGVAAIEMAFIAPLLVIMVIGLWDFGRLAAEHARLSNAAGAGAHFAFMFPDDPVATEQAVRDDIGPNGDGVSVTLESYCECPGSSAPVGCSATCVGLPQPPMFTSVQVQRDLDTMFDYPFLSNPVNITEQVVIRTR